MNIKEAKGRLEGESAFNERTKAPKMIGSRNQWKKKNPLLLGI